MSFSLSRNKSLDKSISPARLNSSRYSTVRHKDNSPRRFYNCQSVNQQIQYLQKQKNVIEQCLNIYESLLQSNIPQKCLSHNNTISLYCYKERKLLCVNCMYLTSTHKHHKVVPIKEAIGDIQRDNLGLYGEVAGSINWLEANQQIAKDNIENLTKSMQSTIKTLQDQFDSIMRDMSNKYLQLKNAVVSQFQKGIQSNQLICNQTKVIRKVLDESLQKIDSYKGGDQKQIVRHLLVDNVLHSVKSLFKKPLERVNSNNFESLTLSQLTKLKAYIKKYNWIKIGKTNN